MIARFEGAFSGAGFSTIPVIRTIPSVSRSPATMPYCCVWLGETSWIAMTGFPRSS